MYNDLCARANLINLIYGQKRISPAALAAQTIYMAILKFLSRNLVSISFPTVTATLIWLDYNHTKNWKVQQKQT